MPICRIVAEKVLDIPIRHELRDRRIPVGTRIDIDANELQYVGVGEVHPCDRLLAEELGCMDGSSTPTK
jgi:hypothetical protein